jgi:hypothetical protein
MATPPEPDQSCVLPAISPGWRRDTASRVAFAIAIVCRSNSGLASRLAPDIPAINEKPRAALRGLRGFSLPEQPYGAAVFQSQNETPGAAVSCDRALADLSHGAASTRQRVHSLLPARPPTCTGHVGRCRNAARARMTRRKRRSERPEGSRNGNPCPPGHRYSPEPFP